MAETSPKIIDLFCSPGGLTLGFEMAGFKSLAGIDIYQQGISTYAENFPESKAVTADIRELASEELMLKIGVKKNEIDLIVGGPPCQGFSNIGRVKIAALIREGVWKLENSHPRFIDDPRNVLYKEFVRVVKDLNPKYFVMENVPGMQSYRNGEIVEEILEDFVSLGYKVNARILNSIWFGVPQERKRIFFIGNRLNMENPFPEPKKKKKPVTVWQAIGDLPKLKAGTGKEEIAYDKPAFSKYQEWARKGSSMIYNHVARFHNERDLKVFKSMKEGMWWKDLPQDVRGSYGYRDDIFRDKMKKLNRNKPSWTVVAHLYKDGYMYIHPTQARSITVREAARLQSFPDTFRFMGARTHQFKQVGNAVPPLMAKAVAIEIKAQISRFRS